MVPAENRDISQYGNKEDTQRVTEVEGWRAWNEGYAKVPDDFTITEEAPTRAFSGWKLLLAQLEHIYNTVFY